MLFHISSIRGEAEQLARRPWPTSRGAHKRRWDAAAASIVQQLYSATVEPVVRAKASIGSTESGRTGDLRDALEALDNVNVYIALITAERDKALRDLGLTLAEATG